MKEPQIIAWTVEVRTTSPVEGKPFASSRITRAAACLSRDTFFFVTNFQGRLDQDGPAMRLDLIEFIQNGKKRKIVRENLEI